MRNIILAATVLFISLRSLLFAGKTETHFFKSYQGETGDAGSLIPIEIFYQQIFLPDWLGELRLIMAPAGNMLNFL